MSKRSLFVVLVCSLLVLGLFPSGHAYAENISPSIAPASKPLPATRVSPPEADKHSPLGRFIMYVPWQTQPVTCNGVVDVAIEWSDAAYYDISDTSGQHDGVKDPLGTVDLYVKQDSFGVWFGVINHADNAIDNYDEIGLYFDDDHDGIPNDLDEATNTTLADLKDGNLDELGVPATAFANPVFIDVNGNGVYDPPLAEAPATRGLSWAEKKRRS